MRTLPLVGLLALAAAPVAAQVSIGPNGVRAGNTVIDGSGVHTGATRVDASGVHVGGGRGAGTVIRTNGNTRSIDCGGGAVTLDGNSNHLELARCHAVTVNGNGNTVSARFDAPGRIALYGNHNHVTWRAGPDVRVAVSDVGTRNTAARLP